MLRMSRSNILKAILDELEEAGGAMRDRDLYEAIRRSVPDLSIKEFIKHLLVLEFNGCISVSTIGEGLRAVNLVKKCSEREEQEQTQQSVSG